jgi:hypothetical protein
MAYRRSVSIISVPSSSRSPDSSSIESFDNPGKSNVSPEPLNSKSRKRNAPHDEEKEMALFRRVRIKTEIKVPAIRPLRRKTPTTYIDNDDPYSDPELSRMLEAERMLEDEILYEGQKTQEQIRLEAEMEAEMEREFEAELIEYAYFELENELQNEAAVEAELNERMRLDELPSDSDEENSDEYDSDNTEEDIDMDYRFS